MNAFLKISLLGFFSLAFFAGQVAGQVSTPEARMETLEKAERFRVVAPASIAGTFAATPDPFYGPVEEPEQPHEAANDERPVAAAPAAPRLILREIADQIRPSGVMQFGSRTMLLFGERRVGEGDFLPVMFEGQSYRVQIVAVESQTFTMRLNQEVISKRIQ
jgi:hypothetical protein